MLSRKAEQFKKSRAIERTCHFLFLNGIFLFQKVGLLGLLFNGFKSLKSKNGLTSSQFYFKNMESAEDPRAFIVHHEHFSDEQNHVIEWRIQLKTFREIGELWKVKYGTPLGPEPIAICLSRTARGLQWYYGSTPGADPYLCNSDLEDLEEIVTSKAAGGRHMDAEDLITEALGLKRNRNLNAMNFLKRLYCLILAIC